MRIYFLTLLCLMISAPVSAQNSFELQHLGAGEILLNITAQEQVEIEEDLLIARMEYQASTHTREQAQDRLNRAVEGALEVLRKREALEFSTQNYRIYEYKPPRNAEQVDDEGQPIRWRAKQTILIESADFDAATEVIGELQSAGFLAQGLSTAVTPAKHAETKDKLMEAALEKLKTRASRAAKTLNKDSASFMEVSVQQQGGGHPQPVYSHSASRMQSESVRQNVRPPSVEGGKTTVNLTVSARVILK